MTHLATPSLSTLLSNVLKGIVDVPTSMDCEITSITLDSREVEEGCLFVALSGIQQHGLAYAESAEKLGAVAVISEANEQSTPLTQPSNLSIPVIEVVDLREHLGLIADRFYRSPGNALKMVGITGTDGKTSVSHFMAQAVQQCAVIGTMGVGTLDKLQKATHTTPDVLNVHRHLAEMKQQGVSTVAMEVSSHALDQGRVAGVAFDIAVLTNLSRDHLDYHETLEAYAAAKEKLFYWPGLKAVVLNLDDAFGQKIYQKAKNNAAVVIGYGVGNIEDYPEGSLVAQGAEFSSHGLSAQVHYQNQQGKLSVAVLGRFNLSNLLAALGAMIGLGVSLNDALAQINKVHTVAGRMEKVAESNVLAVVDYAHTPNALESVLKALREHLNTQRENNLICVFGCGGDRDTGKRPLMAAVAELYADVVIVTDDNPRSESPEAIVQDIIAGFDQPELITVEHDRATAIERALKQAKSGDAVLIAGKGHEKIQILATGNVPFSDREQANRVLQEMAA